MLPPFCFFLSFTLSAVVYFYNGEKGEGSRIVNYLFYPVALLAIGLIAKFAL